MAGKDPDQLGDWRFMNAQNYCRECKEKKYQGCLQRDDKNPNGRNYTRILNAFLRGDYHSIEKGILLKRFFIDYLQAYSDWCGAKYIKKGVYRKRTEWKVDPNTGAQIGLTEVKEIYLDYRYVEIFDRYLQEVNLFDKKRLLSDGLFFNLQNLKRDLPCSDAFTHLITQIRIAYLGLAHAAPDKRGRCGLICNKANTKGYCWSNLD